MTAVPALPASNSADVEEKEQDDVDSESDDDSGNGSDTEMPTGPVDPEKCGASGPGCQGGAAKAPVSVRITTVDSHSRRVADGGAYVVIKVVPGASAAAAGSKEIEVSVIDNKDGTYNGTYSVPTRGDYELIVEVNGTPIGGSPFPVFFSPPEPSAQAATITNGTSGTELAAAPSLHASSSSVLPGFSMGAQAHAAGVAFPSEEDVLHRTLLIGNLSPLVNADQLKQLFGFCGTVKSCKLVGNQQQFAFVEYASTGEANAALAMNNNITVVDRPVAVELAKEAREASPQGMSNPFAALQLQQLTQLQFVQQQQKQLAEQVATMRVAAKTNPLVKNTPANSASQKAAALAAAAALKKRLAVMPAPDRSTSRSSSRSPARSHKHRSRSRSKRRSRSRSRRRSKERKDRSRDRQDRSRDRNRDGRNRSRDVQDRFRDQRDRSRDRRPMPFVRRDRDRDRVNNDDRERDRDRRDRDRDRDADRYKGRERGRDQEREKEKDRETERERNPQKEREREKDHKDKDSLREKSGRKDDKPDHKDKDYEREKSDRKDRQADGREEGAKKSEKESKEHKSKSHKEKKKSKSSKEDRDDRDRKRSKADR